MDAGMAIDAGFGYAPLDRVGAAFRRGLGVASGLLERRRAGLHRSARTEYEASACAGR